mgnify:FL=1
MDKEILLITQEECAEVSQAISKIFRFGLEERYENQTNREHLEEEIGDLLCMIELLASHGIISETACELAKKQKRNKLAKWSNIFQKSEAVLNER